MPMATRLEKIGRTKAEHYLESNKAFAYDGNGRTNRQLSWKVVQDYAEQMLKGEWNIPTHQGMAFDDNDVLVDGQHRLWAVMLATEEDAQVREIPTDPKFVLESYVTRGANPEIFERVDVGRNRSAAQILAMLGVRNSGSVSAGARWIYLFDNYTDHSQWRRVSVTRHDIRKLVETTKILDWYPTADAMKYIGLISSAGLAGIYVCHRANPDADMETFTRLLKDGPPEELTSDNPIHVYRESLMRSRVSSSAPRRNGEKQFFMFIKTWNDWLNGRTRHSIAWRESEGIIRPIGWEENV